MKLFMTIGTMQVITPRKYCGLFNAKKTSLTSNQAIDFFNQSDGAVKLFQSYEHARMYAIHQAAIKGMEYPISYHNRQQYFAIPIYTVNVPDDTFHFAHARQITLKWDNATVRNSAKDHNIRTDREMISIYFPHDKENINSIEKVQIPHVSFAMKKREVKMNEKITLSCPI